MAEVHLLVGEREAPEIFKLEDDIPIEVGVRACSIVLHNPWSYRQMYKHAYVPLRPARPHAVHLFVQLSLPQSQGELYKQMCSMGVHGPQSPARHARTVCAHRACMPHTH